MISPATLAAELRAHAQGLCCPEAAAELLIAQSWLHRAAFTSRFVTIYRNPGGGQPAAVIDWAAMITALETSLPYSGGEQRMLKITASLVDGYPSTSGILSPASTTVTSSFCLPPSAAHPENHHEQGIFMIVFSSEKTRVTSSVSSPLSAMPQDIAAR
jgi:hypothetical protein